MSEFSEEEKKEDEETEEESKTPPRVCDQCGRWIDEREILYRMRIELFAEETLNLDQVSDNKMLKTDSLEELIHYLDSLSDEEAQEATDQVYEKHEFALCPSCRKAVHQKLKHRESILDET